MSGIAVITGTTHGIGRVTARELAKDRRTVVMLCRDLAAGHTLRGEIIALAPHASVDVVHCDLGQLASVRAAAAVIRAGYDRIDLLINNAGMTSPRHRMSEDGYELTFATNHLGPFLLTRLLLERMDTSGRIINVASRAHRRGLLDLDQVTNPREHYNVIAAYARSKLANIMHTFALARRLSATRITANCLHPGLVATHIWPWWMRILTPVIRMGMLSEERGAQTTLFLARSNEIAGVSGCYFDENQAVQTATALAQDVGLQERLWARSEQWTGIAGP